MPPRARRILAIAVALVAAATVVVGPGAPARATAGFSIGRIAGPDRYATAAQVALATFSAADDALVASGENFPDALAGNYLAGRRQAPVLLAQRRAVPAATLQALRQLGVQRVTLLGGESALGPEVAAALAQAGLVVDRIAGRDRFETAAAIARHGGAPLSRSAFLASGRSFADALAAGPLAYSSAIPQLLTEPGSLPASVLASLAELAVTNVVILGGGGAVSVVVEQQLRQRGFTVARLSGADRYTTSVAIADWAVSNLGHGRSHVDLATGGNFPDALAGGPHAGAHRGVILLVEPAATAGAAVGWLGTHASSVVNGHAFGGVAALADSVLALLLSAGQGLVQNLGLCETTLGTLLNTERLLRGLPGYTVSAAAASIARSWSAHLAAVQGLGHNPALGDQLDAAGIGWMGIAENVGYSGTALDVHNLLLASPPHLANMLSPSFTHMGMGCAVDANGVVWVTQVFFRY